MTRRHHLVVVAALLGLSCLVQVMVIRRATVPGLDAVRFVEIARTIDQQGLLPTVRSQGEQPLFPVAVWATHKCVGQVSGEFPSVWALSAQLAAAVPLVLAVVPVYLALGRLMGAAVATAGTFFFCLLPEIAHLGADGISDSTHLLFFCIAFWAIVRYLERKGDSPRERLRPLFALAAGAATAMGLLARAEVLLLAAALGLTLVAFQLFPQRRQPWARLATSGGCFLLGLAVVLGPYLVVTGAITPRVAVARLLGRSAGVENQSCHGRVSRALTNPGTADTTVALRFLTKPRRQAEIGGPISFDGKEPNISIRRRGYPAALVRFGRKLAAAYGYWIGALAVFGAWRWSRRRAGAADRFVQTFFLLFSTVVVYFAAAEGYLAARHLLCLVVVGLGSAGYGALELGRWLAPSSRAAAVLAVLSQTQARPTRPWHRVFRRSPVWAPVVLAGACCLPLTLVRLHHSRLGHREAGQWLAARADPQHAVLDTYGWAGLYSGRKTYPLQQGPSALADRHLAYLVLETHESRYDSNRGRALRWLIESAAAPVAVFPHRAVRSPNQQPVEVYRWYPGRLDRDRKGDRMREDCHARIHLGVRR